MKIIIFGLGFILVGLGALLLAVAYRVYMYGGL